TAVFLARIVMHFSRSRSIESMTRSATSWFSRNEPDCQSIASTSVVLPWSTCATIATLRMSSRAGTAGGEPSGGSRPHLAHGPGLAAEAPVLRVVSLDDHPGVVAQALGSGGAQGVGEPGDQLGARLLVHAVVEQLHADERHGWLPSSVGCVRPYAHGMARVIRWDDITGVGERGALIPSESGS